jgi:hypothetical protein
MARARDRRVGTAAAALLVGALAGCGSSPPVDMYFGTDVGADFRAPVTDASTNGDTNVTPGTGGTAGGTGGGAAGQTGAAGAGGTAGADASSGG